jgi:hypothetical protein
MGNRPTEVAFWAESCVGKHKHHFQENEMGVRSLEVRVVQCYTQFIPLTSGSEKLTDPSFFNLLNNSRNTRVWSCDSNWISSKWVTVFSVLPARCYTAGCSRIKVEIQFAFLNMLAKADAGAWVRHSIFDTVFMVCIWKPLNQIPVCWFFQSDVSVGNKFLQAIAGWACGRDQRTCSQEGDQIALRVGFEILF